MAPRPIFDEAAILTHVRAGRTHAEIAAEFGCARARVSQIARKHGISGSALRNERNRTRGKCAGPLPRDVPAWAARAGLASDYRDFARDFGDDHAARECRKLTAAMRNEANAPSPSEGRAA